MEDDFAAKATAVLRELVGQDVAEFRDAQLDAIRALVEDRRRVLVVQRTGWGKSAVYFVASRLLRDRGAGPTLIVSPLLALMRNQIDAGQRGGVTTRTIHSGNRDEWDEVKADLELDTVDVLLVSPERFANADFREYILPELAPRVGLLVVDEVHCISDWGHDFRPDYRRIGRVLDLLPPGVPVLGTTATANDRVVADVEAQFGDGLLTLRGPLARRSLVLDTIHMPSQPERLAWLATVIPTLAGTGIVYCLTIADTERVAAWLAANGIDAAAYSGETDPELRIQLEERLLRNGLKVLVATSALGMGYDKPDLAFVIHYQSPGSPIAYYQQVGRAGRALDDAHGVLLSGHEDRDIQDYFIRTAFPSREHAESVVELLAARQDWTTIREIEDSVNVRRGRLTAMLKVLEVEGAVEKDRGRYRRTLAPWEYPQERIDHVTALRRAEQEIMRDYLASDTCLMELLGRALDDPTAAPCGRCSRCTGVSLAVDLDRELVVRAQEHLRKEPLAIDPRKRDAENRKIPDGRVLEPGRALSFWGDGGWGGLVREGKAEGRFADELVAATARMIKQWDPAPRPAWVTSVPSWRAPELVASFAERLANELALPYVACVGKVRETAPQQEMENTSTQFRNVDGAFAVQGDVPPGPVLLVDDVADSRWTLSVVGAASRGWERARGARGPRSSIRRLTLARRDGDSLVAILLTTRLVESPAAPLNASDFWRLLTAVPDPHRLLGANAAELASLLAETTLEADRIQTLLDRAAAVALEVERLETTGINVVTAFDRDYPQSLVERLGPKAPALLHVAGDASLLGLDLLGIVGSRDVGEAGGEVARDAARQAVQRGWGVVSGGARGVDLLAMDAATDAGGCAVGLLADALVQTVQDPEVRRTIADGRVCLATPFAPTMRFTPANAMARNKLIYAAARRTFVVAADHDRGGTWNGATEALGKTLGLPVDVWLGPGAGPGNEALVARGARAIDAVEQIWETPREPTVGPDAATTQLSMGV